MTQFQKDLLYWCNYILLATPLLSFYFSNMLTINKNCLLNRWWKLMLALSLLTIGLFPLRPLYGGMLHMLIINIGILMLVIYTFTNSLKIKVLCTLSSYLLCVMAEFLMWPLLTFIFKIPSALSCPDTWFQEYEIYSIIANGIINLNLLFIYMIIITLKKVFTHGLKLRELWIYIILPIYQLIFFCIYFYIYQEPDFTMIALGIFILFLDMLVDFIMIYSIDNMIAKIAVEENLSALYAQRQLELDYYQMAQKHMEDMRSMKHDFSNHLHTLHVMLEQGSEAQDLSLFLDESRNSLQKNALPRYCEHDIVNAVLTIKKDAALKAGISMDIATRIPKDIPVAGLDLCSLFCNLLDNAIEACLTVTKHPASIRIKANVSGGYLLVKIENIYEKPPVKEQGFFKTSKQNPDEHGYGMKLIERITDKYHGRFSAEYSDHTFTASAALDVTS